MKPPIVILRPEPGANVSLQGAMALGLDAWCFPMFITLPRAWEAPSADTFDALLLGSANALRYGGAELAGYGDKPAYCVGETTARGAAARGIKIADTGSGGLQDMLNRMAGGRLRLLRLAGEERVTLTPPPGITIEERVVYASMPVPMPVELARLLSTAALPRIIVLLHSGAAARHLIEECRRLGLSRGKIEAITIGPRISEICVQAGGWGNVLTSPAPGDAAMLALARQTCQTESDIAGGIAGGLAG